MIFLIRFISATALFAFLGKANVWLSPLCNTILASGYRLFLVFSPLFERMAGKHALTLALSVTTLGTLLFCTHSSVLLIVGAMLVSIGFSVSGYLIKSEAAESPKGAAHNKIAMNVGSLASGLVLLATFISRNYFFIGGAVLFLLSTMIAYVSSNRKKRVVLPTVAQKSLVANLIWAGIGVTIGIKYFGVLSVLPQYLLAHRHALPSWYGITLFINSATIILFQLPIIHWVERNNNQSEHGNKLTLLIMMLGMIFIAFPSLLFANTLVGALVWSLTLALIECFSSYLDVSASRAGCLFVKEIAVGVGAGITVLFSRLLPTEVASVLLGLIGLGFLGAAYLYFFHPRIKLAIQDQAGL